MAQKTLRFTKKPLDLSDNKEFGVTIIAVDNLRFFMRNYQSIIGHDDSLPYVGELWVKSTDGSIKATKLATCHNDGWGGETDMKYFNNDLAKMVIDRVSQFSWKYGGMRMGLRVDLIADFLADTCECYKLKKTY